MTEKKIEATLDFTIKEFISTIVSILVLVLIGYDIKDLIYGIKGFDNISITLVICAIFAFTYLTMLTVKFIKESKILAEERNFKNKLAFEEGIITIKREEETYPPVILPEEKKS